MGFLLELDSVLEAASFVDEGLVTFPSTFMLEKLHPRSCLLELAPKTQTELKNWIRTISNVIFLTDVLNCSKGKIHHGIMIS